MTKSRTIGSFEDAMLQVMGILSVGGAARAANLSPKTIRDYSDPDRAGRPTLAKSVKLDAACYAKSGRAPLLEAYALQLARATATVQLVPVEASVKATSEPHNLAGVIDRLLDIIRGWPPQWCPDQETEPDHSLVSGGNGQEVSPLGRHKVLLSSE